MLARYGVAENTSVTYYQENPNMVSLSREPTGAHAHSLFVRSAKSAISNAVLRNGILLVVVTLLVIGGAGENRNTLAEDSALKSDSAQSQRDTPAKLLREGKQLSSQHATCRSTGERLVVEIEIDGHIRTLTALENLSAQRILKAVVDEPSDSAWIVNGSITEFQDRNFILLKRVSRTSVK